ncbi:hypothetical protein J2782_004356 [Brucella pseudogrignonensis]|uniref:Transposase n=1 Tax=Brucella pseudogrignonensis TaxID=419475 RepID=A0ABU1MEZ2_9HYPH|nr:hypothetical protein [Brucella pseudogrignonensis]
MRDKFTAIIHTNNRRITELTTYPFQGMHHIRTTITEAGITAGEKRENVLTTTPLISTFITHQNVEYLQYLLWDRGERSGGVTHKESTL